MCESKLVCGNGGGSNAYAVSRKIDLVFLIDLFCKLADCDSSVLAESYKLVSLKLEESVVNLISAGVHYGAEDSVRALEVVCKSLQGGNSDAGHVSSEGKSLNCSASYSHAGEGAGAV